MSIIALVILILAGLLFGIAALGGTIRTWNLQALGLCLGTVGFIILVYVVKGATVT